MSPQTPALLVGITGGSGSGKSTLAQALADRLAPDCAILEHDSYYRDRPDLSLAERRRQNYDVPEALENELLCEHLTRLREGRAVEVPVYDFEQHRRTCETQLLQPRSVIVVVGILLLTDQQVRPQFDTTIFVDAPACVRFIRRLVRDGRLRGRPIGSVVEQYLATVRPAHVRLVEPQARSVDLVVSGLDAEGGVAAAHGLIADRLAPDRGN